MTQKASRIPTALDRLREHTAQISTLYALGRIRIVPRAIEAPSTGSASVGGGIGGTGSFLPTGGGTMIGPFALGSPDDFRIIIDNTNGINVGQSAENEQYSSNLQLDSIQPNSFVLDRIDGGAFHGQVLVLRTFAPSLPFTISQATLGNGGNIQTPNGTDVSIGDLQEINFRFDTSLNIEANTGGTWRLFNSFGGSGGSGYSIIQDEGTPLPQRTTMNFIGTGVTVTDDGPFGRTNITISGGGSGSFPLDFPEDNRGSPGSSVDVDFTASDRHYQQITLTEDITVNLNNFTAGTTQLVTFRFIQNVVGEHTVTFNPPLDNTATIGSAANEITDLFVKKSFGLLLGIKEGAKIFIGSDIKKWADNPAVNDVNFNTFDGINIDRLLFDQNTGESLAISSTGITSDGSNGLNFNVPSGSQYVFSVNGVIAPAALVINATTITAQTIAPAQTTDNLGFIALPWNNVFGNTGKFGALDMSGDIDLGGNDITNINDITNVNDIGTTTIPLEDLFVKRIRLQQGLFVTNRPTITSITGNSIDVHVPTGAAINFDYQGTSPSPHNFTASSYNGKNIILSNTLTLNNGLVDPASNGQFARNGVDVKVFTGGSVRNLSDIGVAGNTISQGDSSVVVDDSGIPANAKINFTINGSIAASFTALSFLPVLQIDMTTAKNIIKLGKLSFTSNTDAIGATDASIAVRSDDMLFNVAGATDNYQLKFAGVTKHTFTQTQLSSPNILLSNILAFNDHTSNPSVTGQFARNGGRMMVESEDFVVQRITTGANFPILSIVKVDAAPASQETVGVIDFNILDSPTTTTYSQIQGGIVDVLNAGSLSLRVRADNQSTLALGMQLTGDDNVTGRSYLNVFARINSSLGFGFDGAGSLEAKISPVSASTKLGIVVEDNASFTVGSRGTIAMPSTNLPIGALLTKALLDATFGTHKGAFGWDEPTFDDGKLFIRNPNGDWYFIIQSGKITV